MHPVNPKRGFAVLMIALLLLALLQGFTVVYNAEQAALCSLDAEMPSQIYVPSGVSLPILNAMPVRSAAELMAAKSENGRETAARTAILLLVFFCSIVNTFRFTGRRYQSAEIRMKRLPILALSLGGNSPPEVRA